MTESSDLRSKLLETIKTRQQGVSAYIKNHEQQSSRLTNLSITFTAVTAVLTAGPGLGREKFVQSMQSLFNAPDVNVWGVLCLLAMLLSIVTAVITNMIKSQISSENLVKAQTARVLLEKLETSLEFEQLPVAEATKQYQQYLADIAFIP